MPRLRPTQPIFDVFARRGSVSVGTTPPYVPWTPDMSLVDTLDLSSTYTTLATGPGTMAISGDVLYVGGFQTTPSLINILTAIDISDPTNLVVLDQLSDVAAPITGLAISGSTLLGGETISADSIVSVDITDPSSLAILDQEAITGSLELSGSPGIVVSSTRYVIGAADGGGASRLITVDISNPAALAITDTFSSGTLRQLADFKLVGSTLFATARSGIPNWNLSAIDVTDPDNPAILDQQTLAVNPDGVVVDGSVAYVISASGDTLVSIDVSDPSNMSILQSLVDAASFDNAQSVVAYQGHVFTADAAVSGEIIAVSVADSSDMAIVDAFAPGPTLNGIMARKDNHVFASTGAREILAIRLGDPV